jgi:hypothetical protein
VEANEYTEGFRNRLLVYRRDFCEMFTEEPNAMLHHQYFSNRKEKNFESRDIIVYYVFVNLIILFDKIIFDCTYINFKVTDVLFVKVRVTTTIIIDKYLKIKVSFYV